MMIISSFEQLDRLLVVVSCAQELFNCCYIKDIIKRVSLVLLVVVGKQDQGGN
jgi:hypothetical protein